MDKLRAMATFVRIAERGSLTRAARDLATSLPTVVRGLAGLEADLGVRLVNRTTRRMALTEEGRDYAAPCRAVLATVAEGERQLTERKSAMRGRIVVTAPTPFGHRFVAPALADFLASRPGVSIELLLLDRIVNLVEEGVDLAVRIGHLADSSLIAVPVGATRRIVCASPAYLATHGHPERPRDLARHTCLRFTGGSHWQEWELRDRERAQRRRRSSSRALPRFAVSGPFDTNHRDAQIIACERGLGLAQLLEYQVAEALRAGRLTRVLERFEPEPLPIQLVYPHARHASARIRALSSFLLERLRPAASLPNPAPTTVFAT